MSRPVGIVTDSSAQLAPSLARQAAVTVVPITLVIDGDPCDETGLDVGEFYERLAAGASISTATPGPGVFAEAYERLARSGLKEVISLHVDGRLSGVVDAARLGAEAASVPVHVVDTGQVSFGVGLCALRARAATEARTGAPAAIATALRLAAALRNASFVVSPSPSARVEPTRAAGRADERAALVEIADGRTVGLGAVDGPARAAERLAAIVLETPGALSVAVGHAAEAVAPAADRLAEILREAKTVAEVRRYRVGPSIGAHTGQDAFGCFWWPADASIPIRASA